MDTLHQDHLQNPAILSGYGDLLSSNELAKIFRVSKQTIYKEIKAGKFGKPIQIGRAYLIPKMYILKNYILDDAYSSKADNTNSS
jgi:predicted DNA-binding protein YlxM (UPF0122 family)